MSFREGRSARTDGVPRTSPFKESGTSASPPDLPLQGVRDLRVSPGPPSVHARTPTRGSGAAARPATTTATTGACRTLVRRAHRTPPRRILKIIHQATTTPPAGAGRTIGAIFAAPRMISRTTATRAAFPQCTSYSIRPLCPAIRGKTTTSMPHSCVPPLLVTIKGGGRLPLVRLVSLFQADVQRLLSTHLN